MRRALALWACLLAGCSVDRPPVLDDGYFACVEPADCGAGQACAEGNVYALDFCRPECDPEDPSTCPDGVCTARGACLEGCEIRADGGDSGCPDEFTCVRIDALRDEGVCYPVDGCSRSDECGDDTQQCINDVLGLPQMSASLTFDNLYCTARADDAARCPEGYLSFEVPTGTPGLTETACYPPCAVNGETLCPPATTCFGPFGDVFTGTPETPPCFPGFWGLPCEDDTHCLIGRCLPVGDGRRACTETCESADAQLGGCEGLEGLGEGLLVFSRIRCADVAGTPTCVPRYDLGSLCDDNLDCVADVDCGEVTNGSFETRACVRACERDADCAANTGGELGDYRCANRLCTRRRRNGSRCNSDADCLSGACCDLTTAPTCRSQCTPEL